DQTDGETAKASGLLKYKIEVDTYLTDKAEKVLVAMLGQDRVGAVIVAASVDMTSLEETATKYLPDGKVGIKEEIKSKSSKPVPAAGGAVGGTEAGITTTEETVITESQVDTKTTRTSTPPGKITSVTASVTVDLSAREAEGEMEAEPAPKITEKDVQAIVASAIGEGATEADVTVVNSPLERRAADLAGDADEAGMFDRDFILEIAKRSSLGVLIIGALLALKMFGGSKKKSAAMALEGEVVEGEGPLSLAGGQGEPKALRARITRALQENPEEVRQLFLTWVQSEQGEK
ncbi:hypothetical protein LCGC14_2132630, partial [marine sediment metagenome]